VDSVGTAMPARHVVASEVLELGQALFDTAIEAAATVLTDEEAQAPFPEDAIRAAAEEFFSLLRTLLGLDGTS